MIIVPNTNANFSYFLTPAGGQFVAAANQPNRGPFVNLVNFPFAPVAALAAQPGKGATYVGAQPATSVNKFVAGINPTLAGAFLGSSQNGPSGQFVPGGNQTGNGNVYNGVGNAPLLNFNPGVAAKILWAPIGAVATPTAVAFTPTAKASLLAPDGTVVAGTPAPYVDDLTVLRQGQGITS